MTNYSANVLLADVFAADTSRQRRRGARPSVPCDLPHIQSDQWPPHEIYAELVARASRLRHVEVRESRMASPETRAFCLVGGYGAGPSEAFIDATEFCHVHPLPEGTVLLTLPLPERVDAIESGWAEEHPIARAGSLSPCLVTVYAPRDQEELAVVSHLVKRSWRFAMGSGVLEALHG